MDREFVNSSNLRSVGYSPQAKLLEIEFNDGSVYQYDGVPAPVYAALMSAASKGSYLHTNIKPYYPYRQVA